MTISILLADDHEIIRHGLQKILDTQSDFKVVGQAVDGLEAVTLAERLRPDVVIVDILMPGLNGLDVTYQIKQRLPNTCMIVLSMHEDESYVIKALQNGALGYVLKDSGSADLVNAVRTALTGRHFLSPSLIERSIQSYAGIKQKSNSDENQPLTPRESEILHLSAEGFTRPEIAKRLSISIRTVETHRASLFHKLGLHSQVELVAYARKQGIIA